MESRITETKEYCCEEWWQRSEGGTRKVKESRDKEREEMQNNDERIQEGWQTRGVGWQN